MYIVIEKFGGAEHATIATDSNGNNLVFETLEEAQLQLSNFHHPLIIKI